MDWGNCVENGVATLKCIPVVFNNVVLAALTFAGAVALILIIVSGIKFIFSGGDAKQTEGAKNTMTYAIIGLVLILVSFFIINIISNFTGTTCIQVFGFDSCNK